MLLGLPFFGITQNEKPAVPGIELGRYIMDPGADQDSDREDTNPIVRTRQTFSGADTIWPCPTSNQGTAHG